MAVEPDRMVVVDGVRYDPEDAPKKKAEPTEAKQQTPANKSRVSNNK